MDRAAPASAHRPVSLRRRLLAIALAGIVPLALIASLGLVEIIRGQRDAAERQALEMTRLVATAIERELGRSANVLTVLTQSPLLEQGDFAGFGELVRGALRSVPSWHIVVVATPDGRVVQRIGRDGVVTYDTRSLADPDSFERTRRSGQPQVGLVSQGPDGVWGVPVRVPVPFEGELRYVVSAIIYPDSILEVLNTRRMPASWVTTVVDGNGRRIARSLHHGETLGQYAAPDLLKLMQSRPELEGSGRAATIEGVDTYAAFVRLRAGWVVSTGIPTREVDATAIRALLTYGGGLLLSLLVAVGAARFAARRISAPMHQLRRAARALGSGGPLQLPDSGISEIQEVSRALGEAVAARRASEAERDEVLHRLEQTQEKLTQQVADLQILQQLNQRLLALPTLEEQLRAILDVLCRLHDCGRGFVTLFSADQPLRIVAAQGFSELSLSRLEQCVAGPCGRVDERQVIVDAQADPCCAGFLDVAQAECVHGVHHTPLRSSTGTMLGALSVQLPQAREPSTREQRLADVCAALATVFIERARARSEAGESEQRLRVALNSSTVPFCIVTPLHNGARQILDFRCDFVNPVAAATLQLPVSRLLGARLRPLIRRADSGAVFRFCASVARRQAAEEAELSLRVVGGERWYTVVATPFQHSVAIWFNDITERRREQQLLREADRRKDEFLATLAHELRNPLAPIRQAAAIAGSPSASAAQKRWGSEIIERQVQHMVVLLDDLLDISRITLGKLSLRRQRVELQQVVAAALETTRPLMEAKGHDVQVTLPQQPVVLLADSLRLEQIIGNLLTNANKFTPPGGRIGIELEQTAEQVALAVVDDGAGIAAADLASIFQMFTQVAPAGEGAAGLGIGLALARGLAQLHGGDISVTSAGRGCGSRFTLTLPCSPLAPEPLHSPSAEPAAAGSSLRILVADDNRDNAETLAELLRFEGHQVSLAFDGDEALASYQRERPAVALLDIGMPRRRGDEVARAIRALPGGDGVLLVAITGWGQSRDKAEALDAGFDHHLTKPVDIAELIALVAAAAGTRNT